MAVRVDLIRRLEAAGARRIETVSFANPERVPQMAGAEGICAALSTRSSDPEGSGSRLEGHRERCLDRISA